MLIAPRKLADLIRENVVTREIATGWHVCKCQVCNDYKERAGFRFEDEVIYHCWNCSAVSKYEENSGRISKNFRRILCAYGIDDTEISSVVNIALFFKKKDKEETKITLSQLTKINTTTPTIKLPAKTFPLGHGEFVDYQEKLVAYLLSRKIDITKYSFFFSLESRFINRIIIPFYRQANLIYWQARSIDANEKKRYDNSPGIRDAVMFNLDQLNRHTHAPLFITEGVFDAMMVDGVALLGSALNDAKTKLLSDSHRRLVFVIDKDKTGRHLAEDVLARGWEITFTPDAQDVNESVQRFGFSYTINELMKHISKGDVARRDINLYCR